MSTPFAGAGGTPNQVFELCQSRIKSIDSRLADLETERMRLLSERGRLSSAQAAVGIVAEEEPRPLLRVESGR